jgi:hypothetical protein
MIRADMIGVKRTWQCSRVASWRLALDDLADFRCNVRALVASASAASCGENPSLRWSLDSCRG